MENNATLLVEAGKYYRTRDGRKVGPMVFIDGAYPWADRSFADLTAEDQCWTSFGTCWHSKKTDNADLISEWSDTPEPAKPVFRVGDEIEVRKESDVLSFADARRLFDYDWLTGDLFWREGLSFASRVKSGSKAGYKSKYTVIRIGPRNFRAHRVVWLWHKGVFPADQIDHINGDKHDNRIENLREATNSQNQMNIPHVPSAASPFRGVFWRRDRKRGVARIQFNGKPIELGRFVNAEDASAAYEAKAKELFGEFKRSAPRPIEVGCRVTMLGLRHSPRIVRALSTVAGVEMAWVGRADGDDIGFGTRVSELRIDDSEAA